MLGQASPYHRPVFLGEGLEKGEVSTLLRLLAPKSGDDVLDATIGLGGHAEALLRLTAPDGTLTGIDADSENLSLARERLSEFSGRTRFVHVNYRFLPMLRLASQDIILADLGVSSPHFDDPERGFSFRFDGPLDLRLDRSMGMKAAEFLLTAKQEDITRVLAVYGELPRAPSFAYALHMRAKTGDLIETTFQLKECVEKFYGYLAPRLMAQVFQALRMHVNDELAALKSFLHEAPALLAPGGRMAVISFHSLEDRTVKRAFRALSTPERDPITGSVACEAPFELLTKKAAVQSEKEIARNPRARSAKLRAIRRRS